MRANELRIGNLVLINSNIHEVDVVDYNQVIATVTGLIELKYVKPIPLTEEWLLRFGFDKSGLYHAKNQVYIYYERRWTDTGYEYRFNYTSIKIKHIHQLQNLYFALTGEELTIKNDTDVKI